MAKKSYKGMLADGGQERIRLRTKNGATGYRITKFQVVPNNAAGQDPEASVQVWKKKQTSVTALIDFTKSDLLASAYYSGGSSVAYGQDVVIVFDNEVFNQDIYITLVDDSDNESMNYYLELETIPLSDTQMAQVTLKSLRTIASR
jgi:hypothetical protein